MDLFDNIEILPKKVKKILKKFSLKSKTYENCSKLIKKLNKVGYTCDYGLDAEPYELTKL